MDRQDKRKTFADIVREVQSAPVDEPSREAPGLHDDGRFVDQEGRSHALTHQELSEKEAHRAAKDGASVVWDSCGCGGGCGFEWFSEEDVTRMASWGPPYIRRRGSISEWRSEDGAVLLLAQDDVRWADSMA